MSRMRRAARFALAGLALFLLLAFGAAFVMARSVAPAALRTWVTTDLSRQLGAQVRCESVHLAFFPLPRAVLARLHVSVPGGIDATLASVSVRPRLLPLLIGRLQIAEIRLQVPQVRIRRAGPASAWTPPLAADSVSAFESAVASALRTVAGVGASPLAGAAVVVRDGGAEITSAGGPVLRFAHIAVRATLPPGRLGLDLQATSALWRSLSATGSVDPATGEGSGRIEVVGLRPQVLSAPLQVDGVRLGDFTTDLDVRLAAHGAGALRADIDAALPALTLRRARRKVAVRGARLAATVQASGPKFEATLHDLQIDSPRLHVSGRFALAPGTVALEADGADADVEALGHLMTLPADVGPVVRKIFDALRGGTVSKVTFRARAPSFSALGDERNFVIRGRLLDGRVHVPGVDLDLHQVAGDASVAGGVLDGRHVSAQLQRSRATGGSIRLGLSGPAPELSVDTAVQADATEVAALLKRVVKDAAFQRRLARVSDVTGTLTGRLQLGGTTKHVTVTAQASALDLSGRVEGVPVPVHVTGGHFRYAAGGAELSGVNLTAGGSVLTDVAARLLPGEPAAALDATAGRSRIVLDEVYPWLVAGRLPQSAWNPQSLRGTVSADSLHIRGPAETPADWHIQLRGSVHEFAIESPPIQKRLALRYPVSLADVRIDYDAGTGLTFAARVDASGDLHTALDLTWRARYLHIRQLRVQDRQSDATVALLLTPSDFDLTFKGRLYKVTLDRLFANDLLDGWVRGDARVRLRRDRPGRSVIEGRLTAADVVLPAAAGRPLRLRHVALSAARRIVRLDSSLTVGEKSFALRGQIRRSPHALVAALDLTAGRIDWDDLAPFFNRPEAAGPAPFLSTLARVLRGRLRVNAASFTYAGLTWNRVGGRVAFDGRRLTVNVNDADLCGVTTSGTITLDARGVNLAFSPTAQAQPLDALVRCLGIGEQRISGRYDLAASITAHGAPAALRRSVDGQVEFAATDGEIYGMTLVARVLSVLSVATGAVGNLADITKRGLPYDRIVIDGSLKSSTLALTGATLDGPTVKWAANGSVDLAARTLDVTLLMAPLKQVDYVVGWIPIVGSILGGSVITIPVKVTGRLDDPRVIPLSPSAVGEGLLRLMTRTLNLPMKVIEPLLPKGRTR